MPSNKKENRDQLNALLQKAGGGIDTLGREEKQELRRLLSIEVANDYRETLSELYPGKSMIAALLAEEMYKRRMSRKQLCHELGLSREHFGKILTEKEKLGVYYARIIHEKFGIDANFLFDNM